MAPAMANFKDYVNHLDSVKSRRYPVAQHSYGLSSGPSSMLSNEYGFVFQGNYNNQVSEFWQHVEDGYSPNKPYTSQVFKEPIMFHLPRPFVLNSEPYNNNSEEALKDLCPDRSICTTLIPSWGRCFYQTLNPIESKEECCKDTLCNASFQHETSQDLGYHKCCLQTITRQDNSWICPYSLQRDWMSNPVEQWTPSDTLEWMVFQLTYLGEKNLPSMKWELFTDTSGKILKSLSLDDWKRMIPFYGDKLHYLLNARLKYEEMRNEVMTQRERSISPLNNSQKSQNPDTKRPSAFVPVKKNLGNCGQERDCMSKPVDQWTPTDTLEWVVFQLIYLGEKHLANVELKVFSDIEGKTLKDLSVEDLQKLIPVYGKKLHYLLQVRLKYEEMRNDSPATNNIGTSSKICQVNSKDKSVEMSPSPPSKLRTELERAYVSKHNKPILKKRRKTPKEKQKPSRGLSKVKAHGKVGRVWEFLRDLLLDSSYCHIISWEDKEKGIFRFQNSAAAAKLWGDKKANSNMDFKKFSRAMRYNYKMGYLQPVEDSRLVYKFGEKSSGWKENSDNGSD